MTNPSACGQFHVQQVPFSRSMLGKQHPISEDVFKTFAIKAGSVHTDYSRCFLASLFHLLLRCCYWSGSRPSVALIAGVQLVDVACCMMFPKLTWNNETTGPFFPSFLHGGFGYTAVPDFTWQHVSPRVSWSGVASQCSGRSPWLKPWSILKCSLNLMIYKL